MEALIRIIVCILLTSTSSGMNQYVFANYQECGSKLKPSTIAAEQKSCSPMQIPQTRSSAKIRNVEVETFLTSKRIPALRISFEAKPQDTSQVYEVVIVQDSFMLPMYCTRVEIPKYNSTVFKAFHKMSVDVTCSTGKLKENDPVHVQVRPFAINSGNTRWINYMIPKCDDKVMKNSKECEEKRQDRITFRFENSGNGTMVILDVKSAYKNDKNTVIRMHLSVKRDGYMAGLMPIGDTVELKYPQRKHFFADLEEGEVYRVLVWRNSEERRYFDEFTTNNTKTKREMRKRRKNN